MSQQDEDFSHCLKRFQSIIISRHTIDKLKSSTNQSLVQKAIDNCEDKLNKGIQIVQFLLSERLWFLKKMQEEEERIISQIQALKTDHKNQNDDLLSSSIMKSQSHFKRINNSILSLDMVHSDDWRDKMNKEYGEVTINRSLQENINQTLKLSASSLYLYFRTKKNLLKKIVQIAEEQTVKFIDFLDQFNYDLEQMVQMRIKILFFLWIDDLIQIQLRFEDNLALERNFIGEYFSACNYIFMSVTKMSKSIISLQNRNRDILLLLRNTVMPNKDTNLIIDQKIQKCLQFIKLVEEESNKLSQQKFIVKFLRISKEVLKDDTEVEQIDATYQGPHILINEDVDILEAYRKIESQKLRSSLQNFQAEIVGIQIIMSKINDLQVIHDVYEKAQQIQQQFQQKSPKNDPLNTVIKLQRYVNWLTYFLTQINELQDFLPLISHSLIPIENFVEYANHLVMMFNSQKPNIGDGMKNKNIDHQNDQNEKDQDELYLESLQMKTFGNTDRNQYYQFL